MKCPVCRKGQIKAYETYNFNGAIKYKPRCPKCFLEIDRLFSTPEAALEAMKPKVDEELVEKIWELCGEFARRQHGIGRGTIPADGSFNDAFIKQELKKYYNT